MMSRTAVITGASGFIGTNIMLRLLREDIRIVAVYHRRQPKYRQQKFPKTVRLTTLS